MPRAEVSLLVGVEWSPRVTPPDELVGGLWILRGLGANDTLIFDTTTNRYISLAAPLATSGSATPAGATFRAGKPFTLHTLAILFETALAGGASASFRFYVDGTSAAIALDVVTGESKKVATGTLAVARGQMVCLECTADAGGTPDIKSISIAYSTIEGDDPDV